MIKNSMGKLVFLDRKHSESLAREKRLKDQGKLTSSTQGKTFYGADFFLTGVISSINRAGGSRKMIFRRYAFRLTDAATSAIVWEDEYETQIYNQRGFMDR